MFQLEIGLLDYYFIFYIPFIIAWIFYITFFKHKHNLIKLRMLLNVCSRMLRFTISLIFMFKMILFMYSSHEIHICMIEKGAFIHLSFPCSFPSKRGIRFCSYLQLLQFLLVPFPIRFVLVYSVITCSRGNM